MSTYVTALCAGPYHEVRETHDGIDLRPAIEALGMKPRKAMPALYAAVEGRDRGLPLFESIELLGRDRSVARLRAARERLD